MAESKNQAAQSYSTGLDKQISAFLPMVEKQLSKDGVMFDDYARYCVVAAMSEIVNMTHNSGIEPKDINGSNLNDILINIARLKLNANAVPRECYFQLRNVNVAPKGKPTKWEKQVEFNIEGDGYDSILSRYGRDVKKVYPYWLVREGDKYIPPKHRGVEVVPPEWEESGEGKVIRVVYPIEYNDGHIEYHVSERADVAKNLSAHIANNMKNETFGICEDRYKATDKQLQQIAAKKKELMDKVQELGTVEEILACKELQPWISPSYSEFHSQEAMIIRKMRNNVTRKIPKDFGNAAIANSYSMIDDVVYREVQEEIEENSNKQEFIPFPIEEKPERPTIPEAKAEKEPVPLKDRPLPDFMKQEGQL